MNFITILDYIGTFAFAISGVRLAARKNFDLFGAFVVGFVTAVGGGTLRDLLLDVKPFWMEHFSYVLITLMVDDKTPLAEPLYVMENGKRVKLTSVGDKWSYLQRSKFGANAQPFYVLLDADGHSLAGSRSYDEDVDAFIEFLEKGKEKNEK